jgi:hypothetical protein
MSQIVTQRGVTFELSGANTSRYVEYLQRLENNPYWQARLDYMVAAGKTQVLVTDNPLDLPVSVRGRLFDTVYGALPGTVEVGGVTTNLWGQPTPSAFMLLNSGTGTYVRGDETLIRDPFVIFTHENVSRWAAFKSISRRARRFVCD